MNRIENLKELQLDALKEVANIGAGHAATALSQMINNQVMVKVPSLKILPLEDIPELLGSSDLVVAGVLMHILGDITGRMLLLFPRNTALELAALLLNQEEVSMAFTEMERSCISEIGNILAGSYMGALGEFLGLVLLPSVPSMVLDMSGAILTTAYIGFGEPTDKVICIETQFEMTEESRGLLKGYFFLIPEMQSLEIILKSIHISAEF